MRALLIEDDRVVAQSIERILGRAGHNVYTTDLGEDGIEIAKLYDYDVIVLDLSLPDMSGHEVLRRIRAAKVASPVLILSGLADVGNKVEGLEAGAADYITKPFHRDELLARVHAIVRRAKGLSRSLIEIGALAIDLEARSVEANGRSVRLTGKEFALLELLALRKGSTVSKEQLLEHLYGDAGEVESKVVETFMYKVRRKLMEATGQDYIETAWGRGYTFREPGSASADDAAVSAEQTTSAKIHSILLVEDDAILAMDLTETLKAAGYEVLGPVPSSHAAVKTAEAQKPEFALIDINLLDGKDAGINLARQIKQVYGTASLFVSGQGEQARANKDAALGLLEKPFGPDAVIGSIAAAEAVMRGEVPAYLPRGLELFETRAELV